MYEACEEFGEDIAIYFDIKSDRAGRYYYTGTGFVQLRDPGSLRNAWNSQQMRERTSFTCRDLKIPEDQRGVCIERG
eukprot:7066754-Karenia_brevis.AAC.1